MAYEVLKQIANLKWVVVIYSLFIIISCGIIWFSTREFSWLKKRTTSFALFYNLKKSQAVAFGLMIGRFCFVLTTAIFCEYINLGYLIVLLAFAIIIAIITKDVKSLITSVLYSVAMFILLYLEKSLYDFYMTVENLTPVLLMSILIGLFCVLYTALNSISAYERIVKSNA